MNWYVKTLEQMLTAEDAAFLKDIYAPTVVGAGFTYAWRSLAVMPGGEIRLYDERPDSKEPVYFASRDCGLSWKLHKADGQAMPACWRNPKTGRFFGYGQLHVDLPTCLYYTDGDPDSHDKVCVPLEFGQSCMKPPVFLESIDRILIPANRDRHTVLLLSDDNGETWRDVEIAPTDRFVMTPPHEGNRWENSGVEPTVTELADGTLVCYMRTSTDYHYAAYSHDHGDTWSIPTPTPFHSVLTFPNLLKLNDGRILFFYNNTKPLPEQDKHTVFPPLSEDEINGVWEDVFTNRDVLHAAISEDNMQTWRGFRELLLNEQRNACDFRTSGGNRACLDKSVHQTQALELPFGKILLHCGQHPLVNKVILFDVNWLYETKRHNDLQHGMGDFSSQVYLKSVSGDVRSPFAGHCAWNRTNGVIPLPDPCGDHSEVLFFRNPDDECLYNQRQGIVWNFPAAHRGRVDVTLRIMGEGLRLSVLDFWMNPCDPTVGDCAAFTFEITQKTADWLHAAVRFDTDAGTATLLLDDTPVTTVPMQAPAPNGLCYLHLQTLASAGDHRGSYVKYMAQKAE